MLHVKPLDNKHIVNFIPRWVEQWLHINKHLPGKIPVDVHRKLDDFAFEEQLPGVAVQIPLSQNGVSD